MNTLNFETGVVTFTVNDKCDVSFNPTDSAFVERLFDAFDTLDSRQEDYKKRVESAAGNREVFTVAREMDKEMREIIDGVFVADGVFGDSVCGAVFNGINVYALADGLPIWCNFMLALMDKIDTTFAREQKATNPRIQKYTAKYHRK